MIQHVSNEGLTALNLLGSLHAEIEVHVHVFHINSCVDWHRVASELIRLVKIRPVHVLSENIRYLGELAELGVRCEHERKDLEKFRLARLRYRGQAQKVESTGEPGFWGNCEEIVKQHTISPVK